VERKTFFTFSENHDYVDPNNGSSGQIVAWAHEIGNTTSHEGGHTMGLEHIPDEFAIMNSFASPPQTLLRWATGARDGGGNQDDLQVIASTTNTFGFRPDDHGNNIGTAKPLTASAGHYRITGIIERTTDVDVFSFVAGSGSTTVFVNVNDYANNMIPSARLLDDKGAVVVSGSGNAVSPDVRLTATLVAGRKYYVEVATSNVYDNIGGYDIDVTPAPGGGGGGGGGGTSDGSADPLYEVNDFANQARFIGQLNTQINVNNLAIIYKPTLDRDWFRFTTGKSGPVTVTMTPAAGAGDLDMVVYTLNAFGTGLVPLGIGFSRGPGKVEKATFTVPAGKFVYIWVFGYAGQRGNYDLQVKAG
jgi:hypothetical protein